MSLQYRKNLDGAAGVEMGCDTGVCVVAEDEGFEEEGVAGTAGTDEAGALVVAVVAGLAFSRERSRH